MADNNTSPALTEALGTSEVFLEFQETLSRAAGVDRPVLIIGERGTGKELAAARLHYLSGRWQRPLVTVNCASLPETLLESELFGHEAGAFTGATGRRAGRFEQADGGTLFLDEIGTMPLRMQESVLRIVEYGTLHRVGGTRPVQLDVRIIAATNADLPALAAQGKFKRDLLDRLSFEVLTLPPLRERGDDIMLLAQRFAGGMALELELDTTPEFSHEARRALMHHPWPGNIRELKNTVERAVFRHGAHITDIPFNPFASPWAPAPPQAASADSGTLPAPSAASATTPVSVAGAGPVADLAVPLHTSVHALEAAYLAEALRRARHNQKLAAELLGLRYHQFRGLYRKHRHTLEAGSDDSA